MTQSVSRSSLVMPIDWRRSQPWQSILPTAPLLSSRAAGWQTLHLEHHRQPPHVTPVYQVPWPTLSICLHNPAREFRVNGQLKQMAVHNIAVIPAGKSITTEALSPVEYLTLALNPDLLVQTVQAGDGCDRIELKPQILGQDPLIYQMGLALKSALVTAGPDSAFYAEAMATALAAHLVRHYATQPQRLEPLSDDGLPGRTLQVVLDYIHDHLMQAIRLSDLADQVNLSPYYFARQFKHSTGLSPYQYVLRARIRRAQELLSDPNRAIADIALAVGFHSQSHFTRVFRQQTTVTPKTYRDRLK